MSVTLPDADHTPLLDPPLRLVICQLQFAGAHSEDLTPLARRWFEDLGGEQGAFPRLGEVREELHEVRAGEKRFVTTERRGWRFHNEADETQLTLMPGSLALETRRFTQWDEFSPPMERAVELLVRDLEPQIEVRLGLRFVNEFQGDLEPEVLQDATRGLRIHALLGPAIDHFEATYHVDLDSDFEAQVRISRGPLSPNGGLLLDIDTYRQASRPMVGDRVGATLGELNRRGVSLFQQLITAEYLEVLQGAQRGSNGA